MNGDLILPAGRHGPPNLDPAGLAELRVALAFRPLAPLFRGTEDGRAIMVRKEQKTSSGVRGTALIAFLLHAPHDHAAELVEGDGRVLFPLRREEDEPRPPAMRLGKPRFVPDGVPVAEGLVADEHLAAIEIAVVLLRRVHDLLARARNERPLRLPEILLEVEPAELAALEEAIAVIELVPLRVVVGRAYPEAEALLSRQSRGGPPHPPPLGGGLGPAGPLPPQPRPRG